MTRTDYILLADALRGSRPDTHGENYAGWQMAANAIADALENQARGFDRELFLRNCGVTT